MSMPDSPSFCFESVPVLDRKAKPRRNGLTMMIDWGLPYNFQMDCLQSQGSYVDEAKIAASIPRVMPAEILTKKIEAYKSEQIFTFPGGLFAEVAMAKGRFDEFLQEASATGFSGIEISDNLLTIAPEKKKKAIEKAVNEYGMTVMGEVGRKEGSMTKDALIADVENCLEAGVSLVLLEAHELFHGEIRADVFEDLTQRVPMDKLMFELPVTVLPDVTKTYKTKILFWLIRQFGPDVNLANVEWDEVYFTEISRRGISGEDSDQYRQTGA
jgi:phosphosulfolactate synthase